MVDCDFRPVFQEGYSSLVVLFGIKNTNNPTFTKHTAALGCFLLEKPLFKRSRMVYTGPKVLRYSDSNPDNTMLARATKSFKSEPHQSGSFRHGFTYCHCGTPSKSDGWKRSAEVKTEKQKKKKSWNLPRNSMNSRVEPWHEHCHGSISPASMKRMMSRLTSERMDHHSTSSGRGCWEHHFLGKLCMLIWCSVCVCKLYIYISWEA